MTAADVMQAARGKPVPFVSGDFSCLLRPMSFAERREVFGWHDAGKDGEALQAWLVTAFVVDESGAPLVACLDDWSVSLVGEVAREVLRRAGLGGDAGKA